MNLRFRFNQLKNSLFARRKQRYRWIFIYGVPRSGTTYFYQKLMQLGRYGVSDIDLYKFIPTINHIENSGYIPIDIKALKTFLKEQVVCHAAPGGGNNFDFVIKQVNTNKAEFDLICEIMGSQPDTKYFLFREPNGWLPSAMKKYSIDRDSAFKMYNESLQSYSDIGGEIVEYNHSIADKLKQVTNELITDFNIPTISCQSENIESLERLYDQFKTANSKRVIE